MAHDPLDHNHESAGADPRSEETPSHDPRIWLLVAAVVVIGGLCALVASRKFTTQSTTLPGELSGPAPPFELYDQNSPSHLVRLASYLGRQRVFVVFYDGSQGAHHSQALQLLLKEWKRLRRADIYVLAISTALPQQNRKDVAEFRDYPFPLLTDLDLKVHRAWGRFDEQKNVPLEGAFLVDRAGDLTWSRHSVLPEPLADLAATVRAVRGSDGD